MTEINLNDEYLEKDVEVIPKNRMILADTITLQVILIVIIAIAYLLINTFSPIVSNDIYNTFTYHLQELAEDCYKSIKTSIVNILEENSDNDNTAV